MEWLWTKVSPGKWIHDIQKIVDKYLKLESEYTLYPETFGQSKYEEMLHLEDTIRISKNKSPSALHIAAQTGNMNLCRLLLEKIILHEKNPTDLNQWTPLHFAASMGKISILKYFIEKSMDVNMRTKKGYSLLHLAATNGHFEICEILINKVEEKNPKDYSGKFPIDHARMGNHVKLFWLFKNHITNAEIDRMQLNFYMEDHIDPSNNWRHIHGASKYGDLEVCEFLIRNQVDLDVKTIEGKTPLHYGNRGCRVFKRGYKSGKIFV